uniref:Tc1-like transposase DDE domain-containing protein n=1 Tax=Plectus sambesii TaxID=2011161 RepID=A0A914W9S9_9BILA
MLLFFNETGFQLSMHHYYRCAQVALQAQKMAPMLRTRNKMVMATMINTGIVYYKALEDPGNCVCVFAYLTELFEVLQSQVIINAILIMDNAFFHKCREIQVMVDALGHMLGYLPVYSPFFNTIGNLFSEWKSIVWGASP